MLTKQYFGESSKTPLHKATVTGYHNSVWFRKKPITNIIAFSNLRLQYLVTYRSNGRMFIVHLESKGKPNMKFQMDDIELHYFDPSDEDFTFVNTGPENK